MKPFRYFLSAFFLLALCACSGADLLNLTVPSQGYTIAKDIAYGDHPRQHLDIYQPATHAPGSPVIVFFYGGRWETGNKADYRFVGEAFASRGYTTVIADYRLYPQAYFPAFMQDGAKAVAWTEANIARYGGNPRNLFLAGHSAGAYIAVLLTMDARYLTAQGVNPASLSGTIGLAGPYDFLPFTDEDIRRVFSKAKNEAETQPINYVRPGLPPMLLLTGHDDTDVKPHNTLILAAKLRDAGDEVSQRTYPNLAHIGIILSLSNFFRDKAPVLNHIEEFVRAHTH